MVKALNAAGVVLVLVTLVVYYQYGVRVDEEQTTGNVFAIEVLIYPLLALVAFVSAALVAHRKKQHQ
ncbi:conserved protein of unknown function [Modestobacter italicus]|uniref:Uncharacterized protein n=1 Tax=Modestobacter italicus (strain DSM 44449 / CECT 9708 / BC 501) TaxID=2732864 RepID=I4EX76_MODI5|nr:hypothetical protein [Modestobacter marinus]CCH87989.1 conserved protein of unknown function [Modestobacter marinus]